MTMTNLLMNCGLIELIGLLTGLGLLELWHLIYPRLLAGFGMLVFFTNLSLMEFQVRYLVLFLLFSVIDDFEWFWMESLHKNIQLIRVIFRETLFIRKTCLPDTSCSEIIVSHSWEYYFLKLLYWIYLLWIYKCYN